MLIVHVRVAADGSVLPAGSVATTEKVCDPRVRPVYIFVPELHASTGPVSSLQANVDPVSVAWKVNVAVVSVVVDPSAGPVSMIVSGGEESSTYVRPLAEQADSLPAASVAVA